MRNNANGVLFWFAAAMALALGVCMFFVLKVEIKNLEPEKKQTVVRTRDLGEGLVLTRHGLYGVSLAKVGKAHIRKLRKGPFTIGAINELVLEDVELTLPEELWKSKVDVTSPSRNVDGTSSARAPLDASAAPSGPRALLAKLGLEAEHLKVGGRLPRFSALCIQNLMVSRLEGTNAVPWFAARVANAKRSGLALEDGWSVEEGRRIDWPEATLVFDPGLQLVPRRP